MLVVLPARYPEQRPIMQIIKAKVSHRYIGENYQIYHPSLDNWTQQSSLLFAIRAIHSEFDRVPPQLAYDEEVKFGAGLDSKGEPMRYSKNFEQICDQLEGMTNQELKDLLNEDMDTFTDNIQGIKTQAEENLRLKDEIEESYENYLKIRKEYDSLKEQEQEIMMKLSKENIIAALDNKIDENREKCDQSKESFVAGEIQFNEYMNEYRKALEQVHKFEIIKQKLE
ncbi:unnamed protein product [Moneuplotes crassus]|uniref:VPS37 C-terminal domain-containing protein n=1 Tax=Euplotes crassus TaxID=5936 RepID=A0AAD2D2V6_EUPCR|nr:unnamed protein product [Moneuplotes crassus]